MAKEVQKSLITYFVGLHKLEEKLREILHSANEPLQALKNQTEQFRCATSKEVDKEEICHLKELRERLIFKIFMGIENEIEQILNIVSQFNNANQDVKNKLTHLEKARDKVKLNDPDMSDLVNGTPYRPRLNLLLQWSFEGYQYYHELYNHINKSVKVIDYKNEETIHNLLNAFVEDKSKKAKVNRILAFTQFLINDNLR